MSKKAISADPIWKGVREEWRCKVAPKSIATMEPDALLALQAKLGFGNVWGLIDIPQEWMPPGSMRHPSGRQANLLKALPKGLDAESACGRAIVAKILQLALLRYLVPLPVKRFARKPLPALSTWIQIVRGLVQLAAIGAEKSNALPEVLFGSLTARDFAAIYSTRPHALAEAYKTYQEMDFITDWPELEIVDDGLGEKDRKDQAPLERTRKEYGTYEPFPDEFVAEAGWRVAWLIRVLGPAVIACAEAACHIKSGRKIKGRARNCSLEKRRSGLIAEWKWRDSADNEITEIPFTVFRSAVSSQEMPWPPRSVQQLNTLLRLIQGVHLFAVLLSFGPRSSEALSVPTGSLAETPAGITRINGRTYKLDFENEGRAFDWPVPELVRIAIQQQERLARAVRQMGEIRLGGEGQIVEVDHLWVMVSAGRSGSRKPGDELMDLSGTMNGIVRMLGLRPLLRGAAQANPHRFRKTLARLVALAIVGSPKILMDLFGHESIEMTLLYILTDPRIRAEVELVAQAQVIMFGRRAVENADTNGGRAAPVIARAVRKARERAVAAHGSFGTDAISDVAEMLTLGGRAYQLVRPGVLCTKLPQQSGACTKRVGRAEPSRCRTKCKHRLEDVILLDDVDGALAQAALELRKAEADDNPVAVEAWKGQIVANIDRFPQLREKWCLNPTVAQVLVPRTGLGDVA